MLSDPYVLFSPLCSVPCVLPRALRRAGAWGRDRPLGVRGAGPAPPLRLVAEGRRGGGLPRRERKKDARHAHRRRFLHRRRAARRLRAVHVHRHERSGHHPG